MTGRFFIIFLAVFYLCIGSTHKQARLFLLESRSLKIAEPSDICLHPNGKDLLIVSDNGLLFQTDSFGSILKTAQSKGYDFEAVYSNDSNVFVVDELLRKIHRFDASTLKLLNTRTVPYNGGKNKAFEAITFNKSRNTLLLITERDPIILVELDTGFNIINEINLSSLAGDISAATYDKGHIWLLSDEDMQLIKLDATDYSELQRWYVPVINPEGMAFDSQGRILILSDDMERIFIFKSVYE